MDVVAATSKRQGGGGTLRSSTSSVCKTGFENRLPAGVISMILAEQRQYKQGKTRNVIIHRPFDIVDHDYGHGTLVRVIEDLEQQSTALRVVESDHGVGTQQPREGKAAVCCHLRQKRRLARGHLCQ